MTESWRRLGPIRRAPNWLRRAWWLGPYRLRFLGGPHPFKRPICWVFGHDPYGFRMTPKYYCFVCDKATPDKVMEL